MCLLIVASGIHPRHALVLVGHRDEFHARPAAPLGWWEDAPGVLAGRDLEAGGTWLGVGRDGRVGVVTNFRDPAAVRRGAPSRGSLIPAFLGGDLSAGEFASRIDATRYSGFSLLLADSTGLTYVTNWPGPAVVDLGPGLYGLGNDRLDAPSPKLERSRERVAAALGSQSPLVESLFAALKDTEPAPDEVLPDTALGLERERLLSAPFIVDARYGTRAATVVLVDRDGEIRVEERSYGPAGRATGRGRFAFRATGPAATRV